MSIVEVDCSEEKCDSLLASDLLCRDTGPERSLLTDLGACGECGQPALLFGACLSKPFKQYDSGS